ncbi:pentapeptide repeat-containing protein [Phytomonospora sp. NPDC050363]|uniref:pentapeptide repeat-containing protein n=1 Tax=Phytomonospora sp. NPDC050363 TaxID=3155642 RepID=UPI0033F789B4
MTELYALRVMDLAPHRREVRLRVFTLLYDHDYYDPLPEDPSFFLRALYDPAPSRAGEGLLADHITQDQILDEEWIDAETWRFVESAKLRTSRNDPLAPAVLANLPYGFPCPQGEGCFAHEDMMVQGDFDVRVTDARWLAHLTLGQCWETTSYDTEARPRPAGAPESPATEPFVAPVRESTLDPQAMRDLAEAAPLTEAELAAVAEAHRRWLASGGGVPDGKFDRFYFLPDAWQVLSAAGYGLAVYSGPNGTEGEQACLRSRSLGTARDLRALDLPWSDLTGIMGEKADLSRARLRGATVTDAHLPDVNLSGADLMAADLSRADLRGADLTGADLRHTDFEGADLTGADFTGARIGGIRLAGARLAGIRGFGDPPSGPLPT